jgi:hypothetical protein
VGRIDHGLRALAIAHVVGCAAGAPTDRGDTDAVPNTTDGGSSSTTLPPDDTGADTSTSGSVDTSSSDGAGVETACEEVSWYPDMDGDGRGDPSMPVLACDPPPGHVAFDDDCDDTNPELSPAATEVCDSIDNDCDLLVDEVSAMNTTCGGCSLFGIDDHSYALCPDPLAWDVARTTCTALGGDLLVLDDDVEQAAVIAFTEPMPTGVGGWFFGLSDQVTEGTFVWPDGSAPSFTAWGEGEPNDAGGLEDCAELGFETGLWNDLPCTDLRAYVCEAVPMPI